MNFAEYQETPIGVIEYIKHLVKGKVVYEIGAGEGILASEIAKHAKKVVAIESNQVLGEKCIVRGIETKIGNFLEEDLSEAEVIFIFMSFVGNYALTKKLDADNWSGTVISHFYPLLDSMTELRKPTEVIDVNLINGRFPLMIYEL